MECAWVARARAPCVAEDEDQITLAKGDRVRVERQCPESQTAFVAFSCAAGIIRGLVPLSLLEPVDAEEGASEGEPSQGGVDDELDMFRAQLGHGELQTTTATPTATTRWTTTLKSWSTWSAVGNLGKHAGIVCF